MVIREQQASTTPGGGGGGGWGGPRGSRPRSHVGLGHFYGAAAAVAGANGAAGIPVTHGTVTDIGFTAQTHR